MPKFDVDDALVRKLAALLNETGLTEIEYETGEQRIRVTRGGAATTLAVGPTAPAAVGPAVPAAAPPSEGPPPGAVMSPMVGTAYAASEPGAAPFVKIGDKVAKGQTLLIIEAMKVMNQIRAPRAGRIARIFVEDAAPVEYGAALMLIE